MLVLSGGVGRRSSYTQRVVSILSVGAETLFSCAHPYISPVTFPSGSEVDLERAAR